MLLAVCRRRSLIRRYASGAVKRFIAGDSHPVAIAAVWIVIPQRQVLRASVVPECYRVRSPLKPAVEFGVLDMPEERPQDRIALALLQLDEARRKQAVDEQRVAPGLG